VVALGICTSPRPQGNTRTALGDVLGGLDAAGVETAELFLPEARVEPIGDCRTCAEQGGCRVDDEFGAVMERVYAADLLVVGTPLYWYGPSGQLKLFLDRWSCLLDLEEEQFRTRMRGKRVVLLVAQGERGFYEAAPCLQMLEWTLRYLEMPIAGTVVVVGHARSDYARDASQRDVVKRAGRALAEGLPVDVQPPWFHVRHEPGERLGGIFSP
jgi:multimeric flavodoxin WrbA